ncbi:hypothetical protein MUK42_06135 [Musa troglodytarum]|uniref:THIF-type NAD/FAD binding fold domain-containing protein n=1 Tax=Musa troglodytarum TaxID=320322 RepID=A0A9E7I1L4_9LILI|nr:hypothetical protein MUK42_06135 [Musa troglodytarum]
MDSKEIGGGSSGADLLREIERLRAEKEELESRIHLLEAQIKPRGTAEKDKSGSCSLSSLSCPRMNGTTLSGLSPEMIHRYSRHLLLPDFGVEGQLKLSKSSILVVGAGGLGSPVAMYLAACGVGCLGIVDSDIVELNNLHRQSSEKLNLIPESSRITSKEYNEIVNAGEPHILVDVRPVHHFKIAAIPKSMNIPLSNLEDKLSTIDSALKQAAQDSGKWVIISTSTLALRLSLLPMLIVQLRKAQEIALFFPKLPPPFPPPLSGRSFREQYMLLQKKRRELGCPSFLWNFAFFTVQVPCFLLWMTSIRRMCLDNHPGFDTYYKVYLDIMAIPLLFIGFHIPQGSLVYWVTNSSLTLFQLLALKNSFIRMKLGLRDEKVPLREQVSSEKVLPENNIHLMEISVDTLSPQKLLDIALEDLAAGRRNEALPLLEMAIEKDPELVRALIAMGQILCSQGSLVEAAKYFENAISKIQDDEDPFLLVATFGAGVSHLWQGNKLEGIKHLKRIAELKEPESLANKVCYHQGLVILGSTLFEEGNKSEAAKYLRIAATYDPGVAVYLKECEEAG